MDRDGDECNNCSKQLGHTADQVSTYVAYGIETKSVWYSFNRTTTDFLNLNQNSSISKFWFEIDEGRNNTRVEDQNGVGFEIQDMVMLADSSCRDDFNFTLDIAVSQIYPGLSEPYSLSLYRSARA